MATGRNSASDTRKNAPGIDWIVVTANALAVAVVVVVSTLTGATQTASVDQDVIASADEYTLQE